MSTTVLPSQTRAYTREDLLQTLAAARTAHIEAAATVMEHAIPGSIDEMRLAYATLDDIDRQIDALEAIL